MSFLSTGGCVRGRQIRLRRRIQNDSHVQLSTMQSDKSRPAYSGKKWTFSDNSNDGQSKVLAAELNIPEEIAEILINRDIKTPAEAKRFFRPKISKLHDPFLMKNMHAAVDRIQDALKNRENILIYGDYDVDGITSCSLLYLYLKELTKNVYFFIPERLKEGYGFSLRGVDEAERLDVTLIITVDCGITSVDEIAVTQDKGIDVIVTDHHQPGNQLPQAYTILNPLQPDCPYPFKGLAGIGVAFKLVHALDQTFERDISRLSQYTDLVAIGSSADIVPLIDENRILVSAGLERINSRQNIGLNALLNVASMTNSFIGTGQILFGIAPRINAVGRLGSAERAVKLFTATTHADAFEIAQVLEQENQQRKGIEEIMFIEAFDAAEREFRIDSNEPLVLYREGWHSGVIGIVASRLVDRFYRPSIMIATEDGIGKGSIRSVPGFDVYSVLKSCSSHLEAFGGHKYAAGLTIAEQNIPAFKEAFIQAVKGSITAEELIPKLSIEACISLDKIDDRLYKILRYFAPFGPQNTRPVFVARGAEVVGTPAIVGKNHLKFNVQQNGAVMPAIGFNLGDRIDQLEVGVPNLDVAFVIDENTWRGNTTLQLQIKDMRKSARGELDSAELDEVNRAGSSD